MYLLGYSIDNLSLMGLAIAIGFLVDDAIVVIENTVRHIEAGETPRQAALQGSREVGFTIVSMTLSLVAVFIPILLMGGVIGRMFREFAMTVSAAILMSGIVSLTVTPTMCAHFMRVQVPQEQGRFKKAAQRAYDRVIRFYDRTLTWVLAHQRATLAVTIGLLVATISLYIVVPKGFFPQQDTGLIIGVPEAAPDISYAAMSDRIQAVAHVVMQDPDVDSVYYWIGPNPTLSQGRMMINLKPTDRRNATADAIIARLKPRVASVAGIALFMQVRQDIQIGGRPSKTQYQYTLQDANTDELSRWALLMQQKLMGLKQLQDVTADVQASASRVTLRIDRDTASRFGVSVQAIDDTLYDAFGQRQVATLFTQTNQYHVVLELDPRFQLDTNALQEIYVRSSISGDLVPLSAFTKIENSVAPIAINHQGLFPSVTLSFNVAPGYALGDAVAAVQSMERGVQKPESLLASFQGTAQEFQSSLRSQPYLILAAVVAVYIVLGVLYESYIHPLTIISTLPSAGVGALLALIMFKQDLSVMGIIGIILLIGIVKKNAILMIDFALVAERRDHLSPRESIHRACLLRFRPIMMTTMAALFGALPLALGLGAGGELRRPLGISIVGGLLLSQIMTLYTTPVVYLYLDRIGGSLRQTLRWRPGRAADPV